MVRAHPLHLGITLVWCAISAAWAEDLSFSSPPQAATGGGKGVISFTLSGPSDVEISILNAKGEVVRHLAAGVLGGEKAPPEPLKAGLQQALEWDGTDNFGKPAAGAPFKARVRAGLNVRFGRLIGADPYNFGSIDSIVTDEEGCLYVAGARGDSNQMAMCVRVFDGEGRYLREMVPFPAHLPPESMKEVARWDAERMTFCPRNLRNLNPDFYGQPGGYWGNAALNLLSASPKTGVILSEGSKLCLLEPTGAVHGPSLISRKLGAVKNSGGGPVFLTISPDGKWIYLSGPYSNTNKYGHVFDPAYPPGRVYRAPLAGEGKFSEFVTVSVEHTDGNGGAWIKACSNTQNFTAPKGPIHQVAVDAKGQVYVADRERGGVYIYDDSGKALGNVALKNPNLVAVHPQTGAIYATQMDCVGYGKYVCVLHKFEGLAAGSKAVAQYEFPQEKGANSLTRMALSVRPQKTILWITGVKDGVVALEDQGAAFAPIQTSFAKNARLPRDWNRLAADYSRDEIYISNGTSRIWRFNGLTGEGDLLQKDGKPFFATDLAVGYDGLLYVRTGDGYSGPMERVTRELAPAPYSGIGTHVLSPYIYSRMGCGYAERGLGVGPDGRCYLGFMYKWVHYTVGGFGADGKPLAGRYLKGQYPAESEDVRKKYAAGMAEAGAITGKLPETNGGIRVDLKGNLYIGMYHRPKDFTPPKGFEKDQGYRVTVGSVVKFPPEGGAVAEQSFAATSKELEGALQVYTGLAPFSSSREGFGANTCCVCRVPRFDVDRFGRIVMPNAITNSVLVYDNAGNRIIEFGQYGNFDSQYVNANTEAGKQNRPGVAVPEIPLAWPTGAGFTENHIYVNDTYSRRAIRVDKGYALERVVDMK